MRDLCLLKIHQSNHASAFAHSHIIMDSIQSEIAKGRIKEIKTLPKNYYCSPIGLIPKLVDGKQTGWRTIFDLSSPEGHSVNDGIPKQYGSIVYETLNDAIRLVAQAGKGALMMKRHLKQYSARRKRQKRTQMVALSFILASNSILSNYKSLFPQTKSNVR